MAENERFHQQKDLIDPEKIKNIQVLVIGAGAIGSFLTTTMAKMGASNITAFDHDTIEDHNIANQMYPEFMVGMPKVEALKEVTKDYSGVTLTPLAKKFDGDFKVGDNCYMISAVDSMDIRIELFAWAKSNGVRYFIDGRMGALILRAYSIDMRNEEEVKFYEKNLYPQAKARPERCTAKSIIFTVLLVAGFMLDMFKKRINGENCPKEIIYDSTGNFFCRSISGEVIEEVEEEGVAV